MKERFRHNFWKKFISIALAFMFWWYVVDIINPEITTTLRDVPIQFVNQEMLSADGRFVLSSSTDKVSVKVKARRKIIAQIRDNSVVAKVDLKDFKDVGEYSAPVQIEQSTSEFTVVDKDVYYITLKIDRLAETEKEVETVINSELMNESLELGVPVLSTKTVTVKGPSTIIAAVHKAVIPVDIGNRSETFSAQGDVELYDSFNNRVEHDQITITPSIVTATVPINMVKELPIEVKTKGTPAGNMGISDLRVSPSTAVVRGSAEQLLKMESLSAEPLDVSRMSESTETSLAISLPTGIEWAEEEAPEFTAAVDLEAKSSKVFSIGVKLQNEVEGVRYEVKEKTVSVLLWGAQSVIDSLKPSDLTAYVDVSNHTEGTETIRVTISGNDWVSAEVPPFVSVTATKQE